MSLNQPEIHMMITKHSSIAIPRIYTIATSSVGRGFNDSVFHDDHHGVLMSQLVYEEVGLAGMASSRSGLFLMGRDGDMKRTFMEKFFLASRTASIRKEICGIRQHTGKTLHEYLEWFNKLCATYPHHQISKQLLIQYFYEGLSMMDKSMIDAASRGALMDKTLTTARLLMSNMASNTHQFGIRGLSQSWMVNEIGATSNQRLENQLT
ncbi:hypothetical protein CR513_08275, partial [Mucuna pruriens]